MLDNETVEKLHEMKFSVMAASFRKQLADQTFAGMSFEERFGLIVDAEWVSRKNNRLARLIKKADFAWLGASLEGVDYHADRQLDKALIARLGTCRYIDECHNLILLGATGSGKSWLACAFDNAACPTVACKARALHFSQESKVWFFGLEPPQKQLIQSRKHSRKQLVNPHSKHSSKPKCNHIEITKNRIKHMTIPFRHQRAMKRGWYL